MTSALSPTLEDLREAAEAAWLWDGDRARIVWANQAGIAYFGGQSLFDLIDRPFDVREPGVGQVIKLARSLRRGAIEIGPLHFPSSGAALPLTCKSMVHALADGRTGVLVVATGTAAAEAGALQADITEAFDLLPTPAALFGKDGGIRHLNGAALLLLGSGQRGGLANLFGDEAAAHDILTHLDQAGTVSLVRSVNLPAGNRDIRLTARRLAAPSPEGAYGVLLLDDITDAAPLS